MYSAILRSFKDMPWLSLVFLTTSNSVPCRKKQKMYQKYPKLQNLDSSTSKSPRKKGIAPTFQDVARACTIHALPSTGLSHGRRLNHKKWLNCYASSMYARNRVGPPFSWMTNMAKWRFKSSGSTIITESYIRKASLKIGQVASPLLMFRVSPIVYRIVSGDYGKPRMLEIPKHPKNRPRHPTGGWVTTNNLVITTPVKSRWNWITINVVKLVRFAVRAKRCHQWWCSPSIPCCQGPQGPWWNSVVVSRSD